MAAPFLISSQVAYPSSKAEVAFVSIDSYGTPGDLNISVLEARGFTKKDLPTEKYLTHGHAILQKSEHNIIIFIVTIGSDSTQKNLKKNLNSALSNYQKAIKEKSIWMPLMGTGAGGLDFLTSFTITLSALKTINSSFQPYEFVFSLPESIDENSKNSIEFQIAYWNEHRSSEQEFEIEDLRTNQFTKLQRAFYVAGHDWDNVDQLPRFIENSIWENGHADKQTNAVNSANVGDILFAKTTWVKGKSQGMLTFRAIGVVLDNPRDGHNLKVNWFSFPEKIDLEFGSQYRSTFQKITENYINEILGRVLASYPNLSSIIEKLKDSRIFTNINLLEIQTKIKINKASGSSFWWISDMRYNWAEDNLKGQNNFIFPNEDSDNLKPKKGEILIVAYSPLFDNMLVGLFEVVRIRGSEIEATPIYRFSNRIITNELNKNKVIDEWLSPNVKMRDLSIIPFEVFNEIINITELGNPSLFQTETKPTASQPTVESTIDNIPFHLDQVEDTDRLNREPVAKSITRLLNKQIFSSPLRKPFHKRWCIVSLNWITKKWVENKTTSWIRKKHKEIITEKRSRHAFMIHLQGAWGDGKSTFFNLIKKNLPSDNNKWVVVEFNAWQNQHISPPWWTFLDQVYKQSIKQLGINRASFFILEQYRRLFNLKLKSRLLVTGILLVLLFFSYKSLPLVIDFFKENPSDAAITSEGEDLLNFGKIVGAIAALVGLFYSFSQFLIRPFFLRSPETAKTFMEEVADPMMKVKKHFESMVNNLEVFGYRLVIFIDDIDRCDAKFNVKLLEGIQTLYKDRKVLYIVAGDKNWISTCFECHYEQFTPVIKEPAQKLGYLFLEKAFQLSVRLPHVSEKTKKDYWNFILFPEGNSNVEEEDNTKLKRTDEEDRELKQEFKNKYSKEDYAKTDQYEQIGNELGLTESEVTDYALEMLNEDQEDIKHILQSHHDLIESNPRSIKRLANQYNVYRDTLIAERKTFDSDKLFRWLVLQNVYPLYVEHVEKDFKIYTDSNLPEEIKELKGNQHWQRLVHDNENKRGGILEVTDIEMFVGYSKKELA
ncbi:KAP-like P-loop domain-containing protein [Roseivirga ehrenbergii]|uniref:KAP NTPase domain-containing protein n=1 Tax=Roseivirga ehrenbergii (strain DSM 102268 / JCM 13514 / KCTC 12282 / NCIMB 14502 / KMM 6017) TaxID=279360 RepID=A0A150X6U2_ROSEK|nr:P-loop NTPase fold protein [Roseivirga ehrenbergii]KYG74431.1 hypothetical protein MB14_04255 [Roseivirga ehrenbergii]TCL14266.1 KAP-like P-loop domain-containing protein [Roseivirga ehrenbergii]